MELGHTRTFVLGTRGIQQFSLAQHHGQHYGIGTAIIQQKPAHECKRKTHTIHSAFWTKLIALRKNHLTNGMAVCGNCSEEVNDIATAFDNCHRLSVTIVYAHTRVSSKCRTASYHDDSFAFRAATIFCLRLARSVSFFRNA